MTRTSQVYNRVEIRWTTHNPKGLGHIDVEMAELCDKIAEEVGLKNATPNPEEAKEEGVKEANDNGILDGIIPAGTECEPCAKGGQKPL